MKTAVSRGREGFDISIRENVYQTIFTNYPFVGVMLVPLQHILARFIIYNIKHRYTSSCRYLSVCLCVCVWRGWWKISPPSERHWHVSARRPAILSILWFFSAPSGICLDGISYSKTAASFYALSSLLLTTDTIIRRYIICSIQSVAKQSKYKYIWFP